MSNNLTPEEELEELLTNDLRKGTCYFYLLTQFLAEPITLGELQAQELDWEINLGEPLELALDRFREMGCIQKAPMSIQLESMSASQLKNVLHQEGLPVSGEKWELMVRITTETDLNTCDALGQRPRLFLTEYGNKIVETYIADTDRVLSYIRQLPDGDYYDKQMLTKRVFAARIGWLIFDQMVFGNAGNAVYDLLKLLLIGSEDGSLDRPDFDKRVSHTSHFFAENNIYWVRIQRSYFYMGRDDHWDRDKPYHQVYLGDYWLSRTLVTNAQYKLFVEATGYQIPTHWERNASRGNPIILPKGEENHPVVCVSWHDACAYCKWLSEIAGVTVTLPNEAQWEKGARGMRGLVYPWGNEFDGEKCNSFDIRRRGTTNVGLYQNGASPYGLWDMAGNVWEWTSSLLQDYPYCVTDGRERTDSDAGRVLRGGSWRNHRCNVRTDSRNVNKPSARSDVIGFRVCCDSPPPRHMTR